MVTLTLAVPAELKQKMDSFHEINWSAVARDAFDEKIKDMEFIKTFRAKSTITEKDALRWGKEVRKALSDRLRGLKS